MIPGETIHPTGTIALNAGSEGLQLKVGNTGDRPIQVGSHYHFYEANNALDFDREKSLGMRLNIPAGSAVRFEPGQAKDVTLIPYKGKRRVYGFQKRIMGELK